MNNQIDLPKYQEFVDTVTSTPSKDFDSYLQSLAKLNQSGCDIARLDTGITGLSAEANEAMEILKKLKFQGKEWTPDVRYHLIREAGDMIFYWINLCIALNIDPNEVINENVRKLEARYPGGKFDVHYSENRKAGDL
jgi:NTP pyrophosphatase (non-canonical NTP hydrolase)